MLGKASTVWRYATEVQSHSADAAERRRSRAMEAAVRKDNLAEQCRYNRMHNWIGDDHVEAFKDSRECEQHFILAKQLGEIQEVRQDVLKVAKTMSMTVRKASCKCWMVWRVQMRKDLPF